jgi:hypothetical protein
VLLKELDDLIKCIKDRNLFVGLENELLLIPTLLNHVEFCLNFSFFLSSIDQLGDLFGESIELKFDQIIKTELW